MSKTRVASKGGFLHERNHTGACRRACVAIGFGRPASLAAEQRGGGRRSWRPPRLTVWFSHALLRPGTGARPGIVVPFLLQLEDHAVPHLVPRRTWSGPSVCTENKIAKITVFHATAIEPRS
jgi:hypothetical protein